MTRFLQLLLLIASRPEQKRHGVLLLLIVILTRFFVRQEAKKTALIGRSKPGDADGTGAGEVLVQGHRNVFTAPPKLA